MNLDVPGFLGDLENPVFPVNLEFLENLDVPDCLEDPEFLENLEFPVNLGILVILVIPEPLAYLGNYLMHLVNPVYLEYLEVLVSIQLVQFPLPSVNNLEVLDHYLCRK